MAYNNTYGEAFSPSEKFTYLISQMHVSQISDVC